MNHDHPDDPGASGSVAGPDGPAKNSVSTPDSTGPDPHGEPPGTADVPAPGRRRWVVAAMAALAVALFAVPLLRGPDDHADEPGAAPGVSADGSCTASKGAANLDFTLTDMHGASVRLADYRGRVILLNFWATWCGPCKIEIPDFVEVYDRYRDRGLVVLGVLNLDEPSEDQLRAFATQYKMNYPVFRANEDFADANGPVWGLPTTLVIDRQGAICARHMGLVTRETVEREIRGLL